MTCVNGVAHRGRRARRRADCALACASPRARRAGARTLAARAPRAATGPTAGAAASHRTARCSRASVRSVLVRVRQLRAYASIMAGLTHTDRRAPHRRRPPPARPHTGPWPPDTHAPRRRATARPSRAARRSPWRHWERLSRARARLATGAPHRTSAWRYQFRDRRIHGFLRAPRRRVLISLVHSCSAPQERHSRPSDLGDVTQRASGTSLCVGLAANTQTSVTEALSRRPGSSQAMEMWKSHKPRFPHFHSPTLNSKSTYKDAENAETHLVSLRSRRSPR